MHNNARFHQEVIVCKFSRRTLKCVWKPFFIHRNIFKAFLKTAVSLTDVKHKTPQQNSVLREKKLSKLIWSYLTDYLLPLLMATITITICLNLSSTFIYFCLILLLLVKAKYLSQIQE